MVIQKMYFLDLMILNIFKLLRVLRDIDLIKNLISESDSIIHLACISNDLKSFELNPDLGKSINYDSFFPLIKACKKN